MIIEIPFSDEQEDIVVDHLMRGTELGMEKDERQWIVNYATKLHPGSKVLAADLNLRAFRWDVTIELKPQMIE